MNHRWAAQMYYCRRMRSRNPILPICTGRNSLFLAVSLLLLYLFLSPSVAWPIYSHLLFWPVRQMPDTAADQRVIHERYKADMAEVVFPSANGKLIHGRYFRLPGAERVFLASEGCGGNIYRRINHAQFLLQCGGSVLQYDYQGYGASEGTPSIEGCCEDAVAAYDFLIEHEHTKPSNIVAYGESFGTGITGQLAARRKLAGVILQSGFTSLLRAGRDSYPWLRLYPDDAFPKQILDTGAVFRKPHAPLLIVHGVNDGRVSVANALDLFKQSLEPKLLLTIPGKGHSFFCYQVQNQVQEFLRQYSL
ncbi:MAG: prolyl oligopeptidase family serine peptidase [Cyanobacteria bacterium SZAS LIN-3]|nr:prolyl oligopeptidase family serine peptidase [Cyanobacteria bacterium SZAS LIN-3]